MGSGVQDRERREDWQVGDSFGPNEPTRENGEKSLYGDLWWV